MKNPIFYAYGISESCRFASLSLQEQGIAFTDHISPDITHLLLDVPSFDVTGKLRNSSHLSILLSMLPETITVVGGLLNHAELTNHPTIDLLENPRFQAANAAITAECAMRLGGKYLNTTWSDSTVLILGWGRIGKHLSRMLRLAGCRVTVAARDENARALLASFGYDTFDFSGIPEHLDRFQLLFNTVPQQTVSADILNKHRDVLKFDLASSPGMICDGIVTARGLPGKYAPASAGKLIANTILTTIKGGY